MALVMISEEQFPRELLSCFLRASFAIDTVCFGEFRADEIRHPQFFFHPQRHRLQERTESRRRVVEISFQQPIEFQQWLVVKADIVQLVGGDAGFFKTVTSRMQREIVIVFDASEALFLSSGYNLSVDHETRGRVMIKRRDAQNV